MRGNLILKKGSGPFFKLGSVTNFSTFYPSEYIKNLNFCVGSPISVTPTYPGVYVKESPSGLRTIEGVNTSIAVFISGSKKGPLNEPVRILNYGDLKKNFSSENFCSDLARAVHLFFENSGTQCYAVRIANYFIAGLMARTDVSRAVWKAPAGI